MTTKQYLSILKRLGLTRAGQDVAYALGLSVRQCERIAAGRCAVPGPVAILLELYVETGLVRRGS